MPTDPALAAAIKRLRQHNERYAREDSPYWRSNGILGGFMDKYRIEDDRSAIIESVLADTVTYPE